ncbi:MAG: methionine--tRNA ligase [Acidobacteriota bacterium]
MKYYLTTPIYYVNAAPHLGTAYTTIAADTIRSFKRMQGYEAVLTTGSDEHGQSVERAARAAGVAPLDYATLVQAEFRRQWDALGLDIDRFERTSDPKHHRAVRWLFERCLKNGYIYKGAYCGQYCFKCELYVGEAEAGAPCPDCRRPTETVTEENYFFKLSAFKDRLLEHYQKHPEFILPESRRNEVIAFVSQGLNDLSITRTNIQWGIPAPVEGHHVFYVWFDALIAYFSAVEGEGLWPADLHLIGKDILRFHAIYWPAFLMAGDVPLPKQVFAHGWIMFEKDKMSKSRGNIVRPDPIRRVMGTEGLRYFLLREMIFGQDGSFSYDALVGRYNSDLANGLGNLVSRTLTMIQQYCGGLIPAGQADAALGPVAAETIATAVAAFENFEFSRGLEAIWGLLGTADKFIVEQAPWALAKKDDEESRQKLATALYSAAEVLRIATALVAPALPASAARIWRQLGMREPLESLRLGELAWGQLKPGQKTGEVSQLFPRLETERAIEEMRALEVEETARQKALLEGRTAVSTAPPAPLAPMITIEEFAKVNMRVGRVLAAEAVKGANKLLLLKVDVGEPGPRTLVAGIAEAYKPEQLVGRKVVVVANLQPRKVRGIESNGMIVAATTEGGQPVLVGFVEDVPVGARLT